MNKKVKLVLVVIIFTIILITIGYIGNITWSNPDITSKRLFITYKKEYLISSVILLLGYIGIDILSQKKK